MSGWVGELVGEWAGEWVNKLTSTREDVLHTFCHIMFKDGSVCTINEYRI